MHAGHCLVPPGPHGVRVRLTADRVSAHTGKERLAACLGVPVQEAARFLESFLQKYKKIKDFTQATIARCQQTGEPAASKAVGSPHSPPGPPLVGGGGPWSRVSSRPASLSTRAAGRWRLLCVLHALCGHAVSGSSLRRVWARVCSSPAKT